MENFRSTGRIDQYVFAVFDFGRNVDRTWPCVEGKHKRCELWSGLYKEGEALCRQIPTLHRKERCFLRHFPAGGSSYASDERKRSSRRAATFLRQHGLELANSPANLRICLEHIWHIKILPLSHESRTSAAVMQAGSAWPFDCPLPRRMACRLAAHRIDLR